MIVAVLVFFFNFKVSQAACLSDSLLTTTELASTAEVQRAEDVVQNFETLLVREIPRDHDLVIHLEPLNPKVNAEIKKNEREVFISVWGGMISHNEINKNALNLLLCHELGHFLGGPPLKSRDGWSSTEGQADYYAASRCVRLLHMSEADFLDGATRLAKIYAEVSREPTPSIDRCDTTVATRTNYGYPKTQCRLDTMMAGWFEKVRPRCWFVE